MVLVWETSNTTSGNRGSLHLYQTFVTEVESGQTSLMKKKKFIERIHEVENQEKCPRKLK